MSPSILLLLDRTSLSPVLNLRRVFVCLFAEATVTKLVDKVMSGFNATILAYGQTGSGKTHTMGSATVCNAADLDDSVGIIPRAMVSATTCPLLLTPAARCLLLAAFKSHLVVLPLTTCCCGCKARLFDKVAEMEANGDKVEVCVGFLEIYQEEVYDLLTGSTDASDGAKGLPIREEEGEIKVAGATEEPLSNCEGALECLQRGSLNRVSNTGAIPGPVACDF